MTQEKHRETALARIRRTLDTMKRVARNDDVHADAYVRDVTRLLKMEADAYARGRAEAKAEDAALVRKGVEFSDGDGLRDLDPRGLSALADAILASSPGPSRQSELLDAIEGLLITFVYDNPLPHGIEETTRDAHVGVAEELLIHHGRESFVQSRVDRQPLESRIRAEIAEAIKRLPVKVHWGVKIVNRDDVLAAIASNGSFEKAIRQRIEREILDQASEVGDTLSVVRGER